MALLQLAFLQCGLRRSSLLLVGQQRCLQPRGDAGQLIIHPPGLLSERDTRFAVFKAHFLESSPVCAEVGPQFVDEFECVATSMLTIPLLALVQNAVCLLTLAPSVPVVSAGITGSR